MNLWRKIYRRLRGEINSHSHSLPVKYFTEILKKILHSICLKRLVFDIHFTVKRCKVSSDQTIGVMSLHGFL